MTSWDPWGKECVRACSGKKYWECAREIADLAHRCTYPMPHSGSDLPNFGTPLDARMQRSRPPYLTTACLPSSHAHIFA